MALLQYDSISFAWPEADRRALDNVSLTIEEGAYTVLCGPSGCGKTTLLRQAKRELTPAGAREGTVYYRGRSIHDLTAEESASSIGFVQQNPDNQIVTDYVWHELAFGLENMGLPTQVIRRRVAEMASFFGIAPWYRKKTSELSGGQKQLLNLASTLAVNPGLLILDEPTSMLDPLAADNFLSMIQRVHSELGVGILLTEHRLEKVLPEATQVAVMEDGMITMEGPPGEIVERLTSTKEKNRMYPGLPSAVRIFGELRKAETGERTDVPVRAAQLSSLPLPLRAGEGRNLMRQLLGDQKARTIIGKLIYEKEKEKVLIANELWFHYQQENGTVGEVLRGLSLTLYKGELLCLLGGNGAGKTTLLKILSGIKKPWRGNVKYVRKEPAGYLPQNTQSMFIKDTVEEELLDGADGDEARALDMAERMELTGFLKRHPYDLSGGETQRLAAAKLLLGQKKVLLMDEPTKGMDAWTKEQLGRHLKNLCSQGISILLVTHDLDFTAAYADRCAMLFDGAVHSEDEPHRFFAGNQFYTTDANRIAGNYFPDAITCEEVIAACRDSLQTEEPNMQPGS